MRRSFVVAGTAVAGAVIVASVARRPLKVHWAEGTLPRRSGSWLNSYLNRPTYRLMAAALDLGPEDDLLDVACGWGRGCACQQAARESDHWRFGRLARCSLRTSILAARSGMICVLAGGRRAGPGC
jgi:hypothetical protein